MLYIQYFARDRPGEKRRWTERQQWYVGERLSPPPKGAIAATLYVDCDELDWLLRCFDEYHKSGNNPGKD